MHKKGKINKKQSKGITLIALVITIIVLLILAGVTINTLFDNGNAIDKAAEARDETNKANIKEQLQLAVITSRINDNNANIDTGKLESKLKKLQDTGIIESYKPSESSFQLPCTVTKDDYEFTIDEDGNVTAKDGQTPTGGGGTLTDEEKKERAAAANKKIGQKVEYGADITDYNGGWRVYYASEEEMFLISSETISSTTAFGSNNGIPITGYKNSNDVFNSKSGSGTNYSYSNVTYGAKYNSKWKAKLGTTTNTNDNSKATAYLCDPKNWTKYISANAPKGTYAVGGPTKELLVLSWNQAKESGIDNAPTTTVTWEDSDVVADGYAYNRPTALSSSSITPHPINKDILEGLYNIGEKCYWLASPSGNITDNVCIVFYDGGWVESNSYDTSINGVRPIVSIPISNVQIGEDGTVTIE